MRLSDLACPIIGSIAWRRLSQRFCKAVSDLYRPRWMISTPGWSASTARNPRSTMACVGPRPRSCSEGSFADAELIRLPGLALLDTFNFARMQRVALVLVEALLRANALGALEPPHQGAYRRGMAGFIFGRTAPQRSTAGRRRAGAGPHASPLPRSCAGAGRSSSGAGTAWHARSRRPCAAAPCLPGQTSASARCPPAWRRCRRLSPG